MVLTKRDDWRLVWIITTVFFISLGAGFLLVMGDLLDLKDGFDRYKGDPAEAWRSWRAAQQARADGKPEPTDLSAPPAATPDVP